MSLLNIKLKTKNGNDIHKKEIITACFSIKYKGGLKKITDYSFKIVGSDFVLDYEKVYSIRDAKTVKDQVGLIIKVIINLCHIINLIIKKRNINPDHIVFISKDFNSHKNSSWKILSRTKFICGLGGNDVSTELRRHLENIDNLYALCKKMQVPKEDIDMLLEFTESNSNTNISYVDPEFNRLKHHKSIAICNQLQERLEGPKLVN